MMTTMAALLGAVPIALGYGAGGEARQPLGMAVVGGLLFSGGLHQPRATSHQPLSAPFRRFANVFRRRPFEYASVF
jgi:hypothetical protein